VDVQYVVDTLGRAEPSSFRVLRSTNKAFEDPAREAILAGRFKPARIRGQAVRQLVQQRISFNIGQ
jgi:TonB family protein